jgi:hypothetical protein
VPLLASVLRSNHAGLKRSEQSYERNNKYSKETALLTGLLMEYIHDAEVNMTQLTVKVRYISLDVSHKK